MVGINTEQDRPLEHLLVSISVCISVVLQYSIEISVTVATYFGNFKFFSMCTQQSFSILHVKKFCTLVEKVSCTTIN